MHRFKLIDGLCFVCLFFFFLVDFYAFFSLDSSHFEDRSDVTFFLVLITLLKSCSSPLQFSEFDEHSFGYDSYDINGNGS